jgi:hypothetical protein
MTTEPMTTDQTAPTHRTNADGGPLDTLTERLRGQLAALGRTVAESRVAQAIVALVVVHVAFRILITATSWYASDDLAFFSRGWTDGYSLRVALEPHGGHVMPGGMYLSWLVSAISPYDFTIAGVILVGFQVLADIGAVVLLVRMFGLRAGILPPLALYFFTVFSTPMAVWWAAGINQLPFQIVLFWALASHLSYLRTRRARHLGVTVAWLVAGLVFYEKTVLVLGAIGIVSLAYFASGSLFNRLRTMWRDYRPAVLVLVPLGGVYLVAYTLVGLNFDATTGGSNFLLGSVTTNMAVDAYATGTVGGPLRWTHPTQSGLADPSPLLILVALVVIGLVVREIHRTRTRSLRAWWLPAFFLLCNIALVLSGRAVLVGDAIALEYRYQSELGAITAIALACATMPIIGAVQTVEVRRAGRLIDQPRRVTALVLVIAVLGTISSLQFSRGWNERNLDETYIGNVRTTVEAAQAPLPLIDGPVPSSLIFGVLYPINMQSNVLTPYADKLDFRSQAVDNLRMIADDGTFVPAVIPPVRSNVHGPDKRCGYRIGTEPVRIPLDGPALYGGWWTRIGYLASDATEATVRTGDATYHLDLPAGLHAVYVAGDGDFDEVTMAIDNPNATLCTDDVTVGRPEPAEVSK